MIYKKELLYFKIKSKTNLILFLFIYIMENNKTNLSDLCQICTYLFQLNLLNEDIENNKNSSIVIPEYDKLIDLKYEKKCDFCFGIFNTNYYNEIILKIKKDLEEYEYKEIKLITNFCCLFDLLYWYLRKKIEEKNIKINPNLILTSTIRKCFKVLFSFSFEKNLNKKFITNSNEDLDIIIFFDFSNEFYNQINKEIETCIKEDNEETKEKFKININDDISKIKKIINEILNISLIEKFDNIFNSLNISKYLIIQHKLIPHPIYIKGNYIKLNREIGQTKYEKNGIKLCKTSIDEEIKNILYKYFNNNPNDFIFSSGGREDRDVRMLGNGRPFIYEINNAKKKFNLNYEKINEEFNKISKLVKIINLGECNKKYFSKLKSSENEKMKNYEALIYSSKEINKSDIENIEKIKDLKIKQITPLRVLHKRVLKEREKIIHKINIKNFINPHFLIIEILSSSGTYIKEFIHSDLGRTKPSLSNLLNSNCDILQLDVTDIII